MPIIIRKSLVQDDTEIQNLFFEGTGRKMKNLSARLDENLGMVAVDEDEIVGFALTSKFSPDVLELINIYIHADFRNKGVGTILLSGLEKESFQSGFKAIILTNSDLYSNKEGKVSAVDLYYNNNYQLSFQTENTHCFYKLLEE